MKLSKEEISELNSLLRDKRLDIPDFRRTVNESGGNFSWLQKHVTTRNPKINKRILELLGIKEK